MHADLTQDRRVFCFLWIPRILWTLGIVYVGPLTFGSGEVPYVLLSGHAKS